MNNTLENKAKFFAQYLDQKVLIVNGIHITNLPQKLRYIMLDPDCWKYSIVFLELKSLSRISNEDASFILDIEGYIDLQSCKDHLANHQEYLALRSSDYLRSKGYALPWMELSVDQLIEYGWIKLTA